MEDPREPREIDIFDELSCDEDDDRKCTATCVTLSLRREILTFINQYIKDLTS